MYYVVVYEFHSGSVNVLRVCEGSVMVMQGLLMFCNGSIRDS